MTSTVNEEIDRTYGLWTSAIQELRSYDRFFRLSVQQKKRPQQVFLLGRGGDNASLLEAKIDRSGDS